MRLPIGEADAETRAFSSTTVLPVETPEPPLRLAVIGCALGRSRYGGALSAPASDWRVSLLADTDTRLAKVWSRELGGKIPVAEQIETLLEHRDAFDALLIASEPEERAEHLRFALESAIPVLFESPPALTLDATRALLFHLLDHLDSILLPSLPRRFDPAVQAFTRQITAGELGTLRQIRCDWNLPMNSLEESAEGRETDWSLLLQTVGVQTADLCRLWLGEATSVSADIDLAALRGGDSAGRRVSEGTLANIIVKHERGQATHHIGRKRAMQTGEKYMATGAEGSLELQVSPGATARASTAPTLIRQKIGSVSEKLALPPLPEKTPVGIARMQAMLTYFAARVRSQTRPMIALNDVLTAMEIVHAAYASTFENAKITLPMRRSIDLAELIRAAEDQVRSLPS